MSWYSQDLGTFTTARPFSYENIGYPAKTFQHPDLLASATIYPLVVEKVDTRYYIQGAETKTFADGVWTFSYESIAKDFDTLKEELINDWFNRLDAFLAPTDKLLTRADEMAQWFSKWVINPALQQWRDDVYLQFNVKMNAVTEAVTFEGLIVADQQPVTVPAQPVIYEVEE